MVSRNYSTIKEAAKDKAVLCVVSKKRTLEEIMSFYDAGERIFAENRADELKRKAQSLPADIQWHFIGHLQTNKIRMILPYVSCIQSLDSIRLADALEKEASSAGRTVDCLAEFHLAEEDERKTGLKEEDALSFLQHCRNLPHLKLRGIMVMGPHTDDTERVAVVFRRAEKLFETLQKEDPDIRILSMGMSSDYMTALACGSNMIRIGTLLFEEE